MMRGGAVSGGGESPASRHLRALLGRVPLWVQRYCRRYPDRLVQADGTYSDLCVGPHELRRLLGLGEEAGASAWVDALGVRSLREVEARLKAQAREAQGWMGELEAGAWLPVEELRAGFGLSEEELELLLAAAAPRLSQDLSRLYAVAWGDFALREPTVGFLTELVGGSAEAEERLLYALRPEGVLVRSRLIELGRQERWGAETPRVHAVARVPERVLDFLRGEGGSAGAALVEEGLPSSELVVEASLEQAITRALRRPQARVALVGPSGSGRETLACSFVTRAGQRAMVVELAEQLRGAREPVEAALALSVREARLYGAALVLRLDGLESNEELAALRAVCGRLRAVLRELPGAVFVLSHSGELARLFVEECEPLLVSAPGRAGQALLWRRGLAGLVSAREAARLAEELSQGYRLSPGGVQRAIEVALAGERKVGEGISVARLLRGVQRQFEDRLGWLATPVAVEMGLSEVVLPAEVRQQVEEVLRFARFSEQVFEGWRFRERSPGGVGMAVLFSGPPGTGKTLLASVLARELGRVMYRVDLSRVVDKYIGETEKNLGRIFDEAERAQAMLLFDEADSLFAKRTAVKSSHDRYANLEVNYLLQRLESFNGVSILTTNLPLSFDEAFLRRLRFKVNIPHPSMTERVRLWKTLMPPAAPLSPEIDWEDLGERFDFSGGYIKNAVLRAAITAASQGLPIHHEVLVQAGLMESREMGKLVRADWEEEEEP